MRYKWGLNEGAESLVQVRRSTRRGAKNKAEILWDPTAMLTDPTRYKVAAAELEMREVKLVAFLNFCADYGAVSYTHLTLPTICSV